ncbi:hypothetical protein GCM10023219_14490 [Stakelama sediminis]|uniref:Uncharacterized protein n=1 Tax=Stakelama sediminis TaxID=463200 RepID=A0A840YXB9_9SPHN|nr:hypothetical protein [Stakelama sediminis]MBB5718174.1 hypothetical protein [Stakelama sediminis]
MAVVSALLLALAQGAVKPSCSPAHLEQCSDTNQLIWSDAFTAELKAFLGGMRGSYLFDDAPVFDQQREVLGGPPDVPQRLTNGDWLFTACRAHSCEEKGAVVLSPEGHILATGMLDFHCHKTPPYQAGCERGPTLDVFVAHHGDHRDAVAAMRRWAEAKAVELYRAEPESFAPFQGVEERGVLDERAMRDK